MILPFLRGMGPMSTKPPSTPGSANYVVGTYGIIIPVYTTLTVQIFGSGGGGGGVYSSLAGPGLVPNSVRGGVGGTSYFAAPSGTLIADGGNGGGNGYIDQSDGSFTGFGEGGSVGGASGGTTNAAGSGNAGGGPGDQGAITGGRGGRGGFVSRTWNYYDPGAPVFGASYTLVCGGGGDGGAGFVNDGETGPQARYGGAGANASAAMSWT